VTFSIAAFDPATGDLGIAVASKFLAVGAVVPWAQAGIGAVATQAAANTGYDPHGLELLSSGLDPTQAIDRLRAEDDAAAEASARQVGIVDGAGRAATFTGPDCQSWAGGRVGAGYACQGNILAGEQVVVALAETFEQAQGELSERLVEALAAGQAAGGDRRGQQSAALLVVRAGGGYGGRNDRYIDARVDDHRQPIDELRRMLQLWRLYFQTPDPRELIELTAELSAEVQTMLARAGVYRGQPSGVWDAASVSALRRWAGVENLEERLVAEGIDPIVLRMLREQHGR
jgi:uncharacterized Ntn-hydrolase superfamily protein